MTQDQSRYLKQRLAEVKSSHPRYYEIPKAATPANVKAAEALKRKAMRVIDAWSKKKDKMRDARNARINKAYDACYQLIMFGDAKAALKAIEKFGTQKF